MQIPWKVDSLYQYLKMVNSGNIPNFSDSCPICGAKDCATYNGCYYRSVIDLLANFFMVDFPILQYLCHQKGDNPVTHHVTFSLLPWMLIPYHRLSLPFMIYAIQLKFQKQISYSKLTQALDLEFESFYELSGLDYFINIHSLFTCKAIITLALNIFIQSGITTIIDSKQYQNIYNDKNQPFEFIQLLLSFRYEYNGQTLFGPVAFAWIFYQESGGTKKNAPFLFGKASQHRF
ncbi:MAG: hypothetical protein OMM_03198 [Candidatus Magnetoglobus multicellularis str. Araruama]|uniref:Uncharacterized protein n=1 Tax=Candidatus Magnetoglobus multicellularis str. Araruama TaxID=890399 RepID=A0A1V1P6T5_9BACT|nr:MAG: hypothetical protein OMM_03198 [Candidatus Magnetoglobus multicellularis str. Araruama]